MALELTLPGKYQLKARTGVALRLPVGARLRVVNLHGSQVVDTWAFSSEDMVEYMSMEHSRAMLLRACPREGDAIYTNRRRPILTLVEDGSPGIHDTLMPSCDRYRYEQLGSAGYHDNCADNLVAALREHSLSAAFVPSPLNLFMNVPVSNDLSLAFDAPLTAPGDYVVLRTELPAMVALSACPQDMLPVNGQLMAPQDIELLVEGQG